ncbi:hypothetical protein P9X10_01255 [Bacillus cereus]|nr:hypothetical protein [Bacillus cereus]
MLKVKIIEIENSSKSHVYVHDSQNNVLVDGTDKEYFRDWARLVEVNLDVFDSKTYEFETVTITNFVVDKGIKVKEFTDKKEVPLTARPVKLALKGSTIAKVVGYIDVREKATDIYKPKQGTSEFKTPIEFTINDNIQLEDTFIYL